MESFSLLMRRPSYQSAGVHLSQVYRFIQRIQKRAPSVSKSFGSLFPFPTRSYKDPLLVSSADGVGTKLKLAFLLGRHDTVGIDLVAMNVNDILCLGANPLFFMDYFACGKLNVKVAEKVIQGIVEGCRLAGCQLIGGETAEMPGFYASGEYDLAGFVVGIVEKNKVIDGSKIQEGDVLVGLSSSGLHSNGFSLVRKVFNEHELKKLGPEIFTPTRIYVKDVIQLLKTQNSKLKTVIHGIAHITGGAFYEKLARILPKSLTAEIYKNSWPVPDIFRKIQSKGKIPEKEIYGIFNMGVGMVLVIDKKQAARIAKRVQGRIIGKVTRNTGVKTKVVVL